MRRYLEFKSISRIPFCLKISDSSSRFQIPIRIPNDLCWIPVGVGGPTVECGYVESMVVYCKQ